MASCFTEKPPRVFSLPPSGGQRGGQLRARPCGHRGLQRPVSTLIASSGHATGWVATGDAALHLAGCTQRQGSYPANELESNQVLRIV